MTNITNEQLKVWASLGPWGWQKLAEFSSPKYSLGPGVLLTDERDGTPWGDTIDQTNAALIAAAPALAATLLAERKAREVGELHRALGLASVAIDAAYMQSDAEWRGYDNIAGKHDKIVREGRSAIRQALKGPTP